MVEDAARVLSRFDEPARSMLLAVRALIFEVADEVNAGPLVETLRWGEPAYLTESSGSGTTIRLGQPKTDKNRCAIFVHCQTSLVGEFRETIDDPSIGFEGNRAVTFPARGHLPGAALRHVIAQALTYKRR